MVQNQILGSLTCERMRLSLDSPSVRRAFCTANIQSQSGCLQDTGLQKEFSNFEPSTSFAPVLIILRFLMLSHFEKTSHRYVNPMASVQCVTSFVF